jgi:epoxyqueuosine reductase
MIRNKALELGYESCGIIKVDEMKEYADKLDENSARFPESKLFYDKVLKHYAFPQNSHEWAKSIIICVSYYGKYKLPENNGHFGKTYLFDARMDKDAKEYTARILFETYLNELGLKTLYNAHPGTTSYRWAAQKAGLGIIRKNNFFYTENSGSWVTFAAWLIDKELELTETTSLEPCSESCSKCRNACKTAALQSYALNMQKCLCYLLCTLNDLPPDDLRDKTGKWIYGCDDCQEACPRNEDCLSEEEEFPNLNEIAEYMSLEKIVSTDYDTLEKIIMPKFWYIKKENLWKWKTNAIMAMANSFEPKYEKYLKDALNDEHEKVREIAEWAVAKLKKEL